MDTLDISFSLSGWASAHPRLPFRRSETPSNQLNDVRVGWFTLPKKAALYTMQVP